MEKDMTYEQIFAIPQDQLKEIMSLVINKCKNDKSFEQELVNHPTETLKKEGLKLQTGVSFQIVKTEEEAKSLPNNIIPFIIPSKKETLSHEELDKVAGGSAPTGDGLADTAGSIFSGISNWMRGGRPRPSSSAPDLKDS